MAPGWGPSIRSRIWNMRSRFWNLGSRVRFQQIWCWIAAQSFLPQPLSLWVRREGRLINRHESRYNAVCCTYQHQLSQLRYSLSLSQLFSSLPPFLFSSHPPYLPTYLPTYLPPSIILSRTHTHTPAQSLTWRHRVTFEQHSVVESQLITRTDVLHGVEADAVISIDL